MFVVNGYREGHTYSVTSVTRAIDTSKKYLEWVARPYLSFCGVYWQVPNRILMRGKHTDIVEGCVFIVARIDTNSQFTYAFIQPFPEFYPNSVMYVSELLRHQVSELVVYQREKELIGELTETQRLAYRILDNDPVSIDMAQDLIASSKSPWLR